MPPSTAPSDDPRNDRTFTHQRTVFSVSASMVGVCLTAIALILVYEKLSAPRLVSRVLLSVDALIFLLGAILAFLSLRAQVDRRRSPLGEVAEVAVLLGLVVMTLSCALLVLTMA
jgi:hypothetical protein